MKLQLPATIEKITTRADNTIAVTISTQEMTPEASTALFGLKGKLGWLLFAENMATEEDVPKEPAPEFKGEKTPGQRQRGILYAIWEKEGGKGTFKQFYEMKMEQIAQWLKEKYLN